MLHKINKLKITAYTARELCLQCLGAQRKSVLTTQTLRARANQKLKGAVFFLFGSTMGLLLELYSESEAESKH